MSERRMISLGEILTDEELKVALQLYREVPDHEFAKCMVERVFTPEKMARMNAQLGQENNAHYWAYAVQYVLQQAKQ